MNTRAQKKTLVPIWLGRVWPITVFVLGQLNARKNSFQYTHLQYSLYWLHWHSKQPCASRCSRRLWAPPPLVPHIEITPSQAAAILAVITAKFNSKTLQPSFQLVKSGGDRYQYLLWTLETEALSWLWHVASGQKQTAIGIQYSFSVCQLHTLSYQMNILYRHLIAIDHYIIAGLLCLLFDISRFHYIIAS